MRSQNIIHLGEMGFVAKKSVHIVFPPPAVAPIHEVFDEAMLENNSTHQRRSALDWVASVGVHVAILGTLLILPLYYTSGLDIQRFNLTFLAPPVTPPGPPPAPLTSSAAPRAVRELPRRAYVAGRLTAPTLIPKVVAITPAEPALPDEALMGVPGGVPGGIPGGQVGGVLSGVLGGVLKNGPVPVSGPGTVAEGPRKPVRVGGQVKPPRLLVSVDPVYPPLAKQTYLSGVVVIEAIIDERGNVVEMHVVSGHPLLISSALAAVSKRKYEPTILDGEATPIDLRVEVKFRMS
ncbi:MAG: energy transducer TonB [Acidobacteriia bacterium]|nr:energy transducer TonB [Terriglobia bacterium]